MKIQRQIREPRLSSLKHGQHVLVRRPGMVCLRVHHLPRIPNSAASHDPCATTDVISQVDISGHQCTIVSRIISNALVLKPHQKSPILNLITCKQAIAYLVKKEGIKCDFTLTKSFDVFTETKRSEAAEKAYLELKKAGIAKTTTDDLVWTGAEDAKDISGVKRCVGCSSFTAAHLWHYKLMMQLLSLAVSSGLNLQIHTPVTSFSKSSTPVGWTAYTPRGSITTKKGNLRNQRLHLSSFTRIYQQNRAVRRNLLSYRRPTKLRSSPSHLVLWLTSR